MLANQHTEYYAVAGKVMYDSLTPDQVEWHYCGDVQHCLEDNVRFPTITIDQTLRFTG